MSNIQYPISNIFSMPTRRLSQAASHLLLITLFGLPLITPLLRWTAVSCTHDGHLHYHRIAALRHAWENGLYFSRWLPDLAFGYGYPFLVYREPLPLYAGLIPHLLGLPLPAAENLTYILCILACGWFMYLWVRDVLGAWAGLISAVCYMAAPYILIDALTRGNLPESLALPLFPFLFWQGRRWMLTGTAKSFLLTVLGLALLALSHNISLLLFTPTLFLYLLLFLPRPSPLAPRPSLFALRSSLLRLLLPFLLGIGVTFFYSGGAVLEMDAVTLEQSTNTRNNDFRFNFASLEEILAPVSPEDPTLINPPLPFRLGWVPVGLAVLGIGYWVLGKHRQYPISSTQYQEIYWHVLFMVLATAVFLFMALPLSKAIWEALPLIDFVQFPWRFVGRAALPVSFLAGLPFANLQLTIDDLRLGERVSSFEFRVSSLSSHVSRFTFHASRFTFYAVIPLLLLEVFPLLYPTYCPEKAFPTIQDVHTYEHVTGLVGVDPEGSYFPRTVGKRPFSSPLEADYQANQTPQRFDESVLPEGAVLETAVYGPNTATLHLTTPAAFTARYFTFAFPGWIAEVNGRSIPITPSDPEGLITFPIPAGEHTITVRWGSTPLRTTLAVLSLAALVGVLGIGYWIFVNQRFVERGSDRTSGKVEKWLLLVGVVMVGAKLGVADVFNTPLRRAAHPPVAQTAVLQTSELRLEGFNLSQQTVTSGSTFDIDLAWTVLSPPTADYQSNVWLVGPEGLIWSEKGTQRPRLYETAPSTRQWLPGQWAWDSREVQLLAGTPPGSYDIILTLFDVATLQPLTLLDENGAVVGPTAVIGQIIVTAPFTQPLFEMQYALPATLPEVGVNLLGYNLDREQAIPGEQFLLTLFWEQGTVQPASNFTLHLWENGNIHHTWQLPFTRADFVGWQPGLRLRSQYLLRLPASLQTNDYQFELNGVLLGQLAVQAPIRLFEQPLVETAVSIPFVTPTTNHSQTILTGYTLPNYPIPNTQYPLTLTWQATAEMPISYHVFVHLVDESGQLIAQADGEPASWTRPTTGWAVGEYILDTHTLSLPAELPPSPLFLRIGLYDADTGERLWAETAEFFTITLDE